MSDLLLGECGAEACDACEAADLLEVRDQYVQYAVAELHVSLFPCAGVEALLLGLPMTE